eukprot:TRINITY_DN131_c0_g1_i1.p1 TRINITY_DN131_c0_g1~~TRINITY_DN131_c0_g1_i1.p1  ORF type:complete len:291 (-),score=72.79 TRINITY_DN131_c0_g1_i1:85-876(-)
MRVTPTAMVGLLLLSLSLCVFSQDVSSLISASCTMQAQGDGITLTIFSKNFPSPQPLLPNTHTWMQIYNVKDLGRRTRSDDCSQALYSFSSEFTARTSGEGASIYLPDIVPGNSYALIAWAGDDSCEYRRETVYFTTNECDVIRPDAPSGGSTGWDWDSPTPPTESHSSLSFGINLLIVGAVLFAIAVITCICIRRCLIKRSSSSPQYVGVPTTPAQTTQELYTVTPSEYGVPAAPTYVSSVPPVADFDPTATMTPVYIQSNH